MVKSDSALGCCCLCGEVTSRSSPNNVQLEGIRDEIISVIFQSSIKNTSCKWYKPTGRPYVLETKIGRVAGRPNRRYLNLTIVYQGLQTCNSKSEAGNLKAWTLNVEVQIRMIRRPELDLFRVQNRHTSRLPQESSYNSTVYPATALVRILCAG